MATGKPINLREAARLLFEERLTRKQIAKRLGVCQDRLRHAMQDFPVSAGKREVQGPCRLVVAQAVNAEAAEQRRQDIIRLVGEGVPRGEVAKRLGCSRASVWRAVNPAHKSAVPVPAWVPAYLRDTYQLVGQRLGEEEAASRVRRLKQEAERACL